MRAALAAACASACALALTATPAAAEPRDPRALEAFFDGLLPGLLAAERAPGAVVSVVEDGRLVFEKGYGFADLATGRGMDPERTRMRLASVSKLVTATAALQLVAAGQLDLHADVNRYLDGFRIEEGFGGPVTLHHLLTHTGGFDDRFLGTSRALGAALPPLGDYLALRMPPRVMPAGRVVSYSNHGLALVGHLVERASGLSFADYVQRHVFDPLAMTRSRFFLEVPLHPELAVPYRSEGGRYEPMGVDHTLLGPAAELNSTARDMANFMLAHLADGAFAGRRILPPETARQMRERHFSVHPEVAGWGYGFQESFVNGRRAVGHGGDWRGFKSQLLLFPEEGLGVFASVNGAVDDLRFWNAFQRGLGDHFFPAAAAAAPAPAPDFAARAARYTGTYLPNRRMRGDVFRLAELISHVSVDADASGLTLAAAGGFALRLEPAGEDLFRAVGFEGNAWYFEEADTGVAHLVVGPFLTLDKVRGWANPRLHLLLGGASLALLAGTLGGWGLGFAARRLAHAAPSPTTRAARGVGVAACALLLAGTAGIGRELAPERAFDLMIGFPPTLWAALATLHAAVPFVLALPVFARRGFRAGVHAPLARLHYAGLALAGLVLLAQAWHFHLLGPAAFR
jgi:CubicO group peptidase (beta-lactamase class C family)